MAAPVGFVVTQASTGLLVALGLFLIWVRPRRRGTVAFGVAVSALGLAVFVQNLYLQGSMAEAVLRAPPSLVLVVAASWAASAAATTVAAVSLPRPLERSERGSLVWFAVPTVGLGILYGFAGVAMLAEVPAVPSATYAAFMASVLAAGFAVGSYVGAGALFAARFRATPPSARADRLHYALMTAGLVPYIAFSAGLGLADPHLQALGIVISAAALYVTLLWLRATTVARDAHLARNVALLLPACALVGLGVSIASGGLFGLDATGAPAVIRLGTFALLGYAILRHQLFGIQLAARRLAGRPELEKERHALYRTALAELTGAVRGDDLLASLRRTLGISMAEHAGMAQSVAAEALRGRVERRGRFQVVREIGRGGQGRALLARDLDLDREVVLKEPFAAGARERERDRFLGEARAAARVQHPNVVGVHAILADDDPPLLVLEYVPGGDLQALVEREGPVPPDRTARIGLDVLAGLARLHADGIVHRDLKPANILLDATGTAKVADLGLAARAGAAQPGGTPGFVAPEVARGASPDERSDVWGVGAVLHAALTGAPPAAGATPDSAAPETVLRAPRIALPDSALARVVERALDPDPSRRYADAAAMRAELERAMPEIQGRVAPARGG